MKEVPSHKGREGKYIFFECFPKMLSQLHCFTAFMLSLLTLLTLLSLLSLLLPLSVLTLLTLLFSTVYSAFIVY